MKLDVKPSVIQMEDETFKQLVAEVKETVASIDRPLQKKRSFGPVDLWNIRRNSRPAGSRLKR